LFVTIHKVFLICIVLGIFRELKMVVSPYFINGYMNRTNNNIYNNENDK